MICTEHTAMSELQGNSTTCLLLRFLTENRRSGPRDKPLSWTISSYPVVPGHQFTYVLEAGVSEMLIRSPGCQDLETRWVQRFCGTRI